MQAVKKIRDIADAVACGCTDSEIMADVEVLRAILEWDGVTGG